MKVYIVILTTRPDDFFGYEEVLDVFANKDDAINYIKNFDFNVFKSFEGIDEEFYYENEEASSEIFERDVHSNKEWYYLDIEEHEVKEKTDG